MTLALFGALLLTAPVWLGLFLGYLAGDFSR